MRKDISSKYDDELDKEFSDTDVALDMDDESPYINSGVMLMNLKRLREEQNYEDVFDFIEKRKSFLMLPDQDIISSLYGSKIFALDTFRYNMRL